MKNLITLSAVFCVACVTACAADSTPAPDDHASDTTSGDDTGAEATKSSAEQAQPQYTTPAVDATFADGCQIRFWCHNDNAAADDAGFCIKNACNGSAPSHAASFCANNCDAAACSAISNFGPCG